jgi:2-polyprenyl-6-methoxyphenol hydroxylase-like FAD-dependent oxidoreductase
MVWDCLVIGGGATGLGVAVEAASRGLRTLLIERTDFAKGTSSRATKLAHGGVRYLEQGNINSARILTRRCAPPLTGTWCGRRCARRVARARALARFEIQPSDFNRRLDNILRSSTTQLSELAHSVQMIQELWSEIVTLTHGSYAPESFCELSRQPSIGAR